MPAPLKRLAAFECGGCRASQPRLFLRPAHSPHPRCQLRGVSWASKTKGGLRLDSYAALMKGGKDGPVIVPRNADKSLLIERVTLPAGDKHFMPAEGRPPLKPDGDCLDSCVDSGRARRRLTRNVAGVLIPRRASASCRRNRWAITASGHDEIEQMRHAHRGEAAPGLQQAVRWIDSEHSGYCGTLSATLSWRSSKSTRLTSWRPTWRAPP